MADITVTAAKVGVCDPMKAEIYPFVAAETITAGQAVFVDSNGKVQLADANASGEQQCAGIALNGGGAGQAIDVLKKGRVYGFTLSGAYWSSAFLSDTVGALGTTAGTMTVPVGRVVPLSDSDKTKVLHVEINWSTVWA
jgi:hypothetical protein